MSCQCGTAHAPVTRGGVCCVKISLEVVSLKMFWEHANLRVGYETLESVAKSKMKKAFNLFLQLGVN